jgi:hypothetical protein
MKNWQSSYWKFFNGAVRVVGFVFMVIGFLMALCGLFLPVAPGWDSFTKKVGVIIGLLGVFLGFLLLKARASNPTEFWKKIFDKLKGQ